MDENYNPRINSIKDSVMAEMIVEEICKLANYHNKILDSNLLLESKYQQMENLLNKQEQTINTFMIHVNKYNEFIKKYAELTRTAVDLSESLIKVQKKGINISDEGRTAINDTLKEANIPIFNYLKYLLFGIGFAFFLLFIAAIFI